MYCSCCLFLSISHTTHLYDFYSCCQKKKISDINTKQPDIKQQNRIDKYKAIKMCWIFSCLFHVFPRAISFLLMHLKHMHVSNVIVESHQCHSHICIDYEYDIFVDLKSNGKNHFHCNLYTEYRIRAAIIIIIIYILYCLFPLCHTAPKTITLH